MSVDITRMTEHLSPAQQQVVRRAYRQRAQSETAAFLWCFFLGITGAHRMYLGQWRRAIGHLVLFIALVAAVAAGVLLSWPPALTAAIAVPLLLLALVWVVVDLFRIDDEVARRNLALAEKLTGEAMLDDPTRERQALETLAAVEEREAAAPVPVAAAVTVSPDDPRPVAEAAVATPDTLGVGAGVAEPFEEQVAPQTAPQPYPVEIAPAEVRAVTGFAGLAEGAGYRVVSPDEAASASAASAAPVSESEPESESAVAEAGTSWGAETAAAVAAVDAATAAAFVPLYRAGGEAASPAPEWPVAQGVTQEPVPAAVGDDIAAGLAALDVQAAEDAPAAEPVGYAAHEERSPGFVDASVAATSAAAAGAASVFAAEYADPTPSPAEVASVGVGGPGAPRDVTDLGDEGVRFTPISDVEPESAWQALFEGAVPAGAADPGDAALLLVPESSPVEAAPVWPSSAEWPATEAAPDRIAEAESATSETLEELAPFAAGAALGGGLLAYEASRREEFAATDDGMVARTTAEQEKQTARASADQPAVPTVAEPAPPVEPVAAAGAPAPAPSDETPRHLLKHIRVVRQVKVGDEVVEESVAEAYISPDEDPEPVRQRLREQLRREADEKRQREGQP